VFARTGKGDLVALQIDVPFAPDWMPVVGGGFVHVVTIGDSNPHERQLLHTSKRQPITPYFHSYGVTTNHVILGYTPMRYDMFPSIEGKPMIDAFTQSTPLATKFSVIPFDGSTAIEMDAPVPFTYNHVVNCYENETGIVFMATTWQVHRSLAFNRRMVPL